jgi:hypothetical protein
VVNFLGDWEGAILLCALKQKFRNGDLTVEGVHVETVSAMAGTTGVLIAPFRPIAALSLNELYLSLPLSQLGTKLSAFLGMKLSVFSYRICPHFISQTQTFSFFCLGHTVAQVLRYKPGRGVV